MAASLFGCLLSLLRVLVDRLLFCWFVGSFARLFVFGLVCSCVCLFVGSFACVCVWFLARLPMCVFLCVCLSVCQCLSVCLASTGVFCVIVSCLRVLLFACLSGFVFLCFCSSSAFVVLMRMCCLVHPRLS